MMLIVEQKQNAASMVAHPSASNQYWKAKPAVRRRMDLDNAVISIVKVHVPKEAAAGMESGDSVSSPPALIRVPVERLNLIKRQIGTCGQDGVTVPVIRSFRPRLEPVVTVDQAKARVSVPRHERKSATKAKLWRNVVHSGPPGQSGES